MQPYYPYQYPQWPAQSAGAVGVATQGQSQGQPAQAASAPWPSAAQQYPAGQQTGTGEQAQSATGQLPVGAPQIDIVEHPSTVEVFVDIPGFDEDDIQLDADPQTLRVIAERELTYPEESIPIQRERPARVERTVQIPVRVVVEEAEATYEAGVCRITLPKHDAAEGTHTRIGFH